MGFLIACSSLIERVICMCSTIGALTWFFDFDHSLCILCWNCSSLYKEICSWQLKSHVENLWNGIALYKPPYQWISWRSGSNRLSFKNNVIWISNFTKIVTFKRNYLKLVWRRWSTCFALFFWLSSEKQRSTSRSSKNLHCFVLSILRLSPISICLISPCLLI